MNLAADHRVVDGRDIINFGLAIRRHLEAPLGLLFDGELMVAGEIARPVDVLVLGGGPGGYTAAARAVELGREVVLVESAQLGGTCLNVGCIPSKALISLAHDLERARHRVAAGTGLVGQVDVDLAAGQRWMDGVVGRLRDGVGTLLRGVEVVHGTGRFVGRDRVAVEAEDHVEHLQFRDAIIATGSRPAELPALPVDQVRILDSTGALALTERARRPRRGRWRLHRHRAGHGLRPPRQPGHDRRGRRPDPRRVRRRRRRRRPPAPRRARRRGAHRRRRWSADDGDAVIVDERGRRPNGSRRPTCSSPSAGGRTPTTCNSRRPGWPPAPDGRIAVDEQQRTAVPTIFAIGDVTDGPALAHKAYAAGPGRRRGDVRRCRRRSTNSCR